MTGITVKSVVLAVVLIDAAHLSGEPLYNFATFLVPGGQPPDFVGATGINNAGQITGVYANATLISSYIRNRDGSFITFDAPGRVETYSDGINDVGQVVGYTSSLGIPQIHQAFLRSADGSTYTPINGPDAGDQLYPSDINNAGQIIGSIQTPTTVTGYMRNMDGSSILFGVPGVVETFPSGINNLGAIVGFYRTGAEEHGFLRNPDGSFILFDSPGLRDINDLGEIVGTLGRLSFVRHPDGSIVYFEVPGQYNTRASAINNRGEVAGIFEGPGILRGGFLATPVPEPAGTSLFVALVVGLAVCSACRSRTPSCESVHRGNRGGGWCLACNSDAPGFSAPRLRHPDDPEQLTAGVHHHGSKTGLWTIDAVTVD